MKWIFMVIHGDDHVSMGFQGVLVVLKGATTRGYER